MFAANRPPPDGCEICGKRGPLVFDHCHSTGEFRGWLCNGCNLSIGRLGDTVEAIERALNYLKNYRRLAVLGDDKERPAES